MSADVDVVEDGHWEAGQSAHVDLVRCETCGGADSIIIRELDVWQVQVPVVLTFVHNHGNHLCHCVVDTLDTAVAVGVLCACGDFAHSHASEDGGREL